MRTIAFFALFIIAQLIVGCKESKETSEEKLKSDYCLINFLDSFFNFMASHKAYELHSNQEEDKAAVIYREILNREPDNEFAKENLKQIELHKLEEKAYEFHSNKNYTEARNYTIKF